MLLKLIARLGQQLLDCIHLKVVMKLKTRTLVQFQYTTHTCKVDNEMLTMCIMYLMQKGILQSYLSEDQL